MNLWEYRHKAPSWDVVEVEGIQVTERELTDEEIREWTKKLSDSGERSCLPVLPAQRCGRSS